MTHIAVIDIGKTNAKLALVDGASLSEIAVVTRPNLPLPGPPWPHVDLEGHWAFFLTHLRAFQDRHGVDAISVTTHGAAAVLLDDRGGLAAPMLDYEHPGPDDLAAAYDTLRPDFATTGSPRLPAGLNLGAQLHWLMEQPGVAGRVAQVITFPQYWGWRLTGVAASDMTSLGCHTDLWDPWQGRFSNLVAALGLEGRIAPARRADAILGGLTGAVAEATGIAKGTPVVVGIHDSNASLMPHLRAQEGAFSVISTGTWVVAMSVGGGAGTMDPARDVLVNVNAMGQPVPSARFMGGREFERMRPATTTPPTAADRHAVLESCVMLLPSVQSGSGPFPHGRMQWIGTTETDGARMVALSWYLAMMTRTCLDLIAARGPTIIEGPFTRNADYLDMLTALCPDGVQIAASSTGTSVGAALLCIPEAVPPATRALPQAGYADALRAYAQDWQARVVCR